MRHYFLGLMLYFTSFAFAAEITFDSQLIDANTQKIKVHFSLDSYELFYTEYLKFSADNPNINLSEWESNKESTNAYDPVTQKNKNILQKDFTISLEAKKDDNATFNDTHLHMVYYTNAYPHPLKKLYSLAPENKEKNPEKNLKNNSEKISHENKKQSIKKPEQSTPSQQFSTSKYIKQLLKKTNSLPIRLLLIYLLGILLSLTPCIYPMIPITVGILQTQASNSIVRNFLLALFYTIGMSFTYAGLGLLASCTGPFCGRFLSHPATVLLLVAILAYFAFSLFDFYPMYTPRFLSQPQKMQKKGSFISALLFGSVSGTIASPCVSPGLALVLSIAATIGNPFLGFLLLFVFGAGLSTPLLIIGTFSSSINMLPRAGSWMDEIKKIFGFLLLGLCFYYLKNIISWHILIWFLGLFITISGISYLYAAFKKDSRFWQRFNTMLGILLIAGSILIYYEAIQETFWPDTIQETKENTIWYHNYSNARKQALQENKLLFIDFWAQWCSICIAINNGILKNTEVLDALHKHYIPVKVDGTKSDTEPYKTLQNKFNIAGFPTFIIVDPKNERIIKKFGSEIYSYTQEKLIQKLSKHAQKKGV